MEVPLWHLRSVQGWALGNSDSTVSRSAKPSRREDRELVDLADSEDLVPSKGLEPPHPCGYMDLNHARLPIPPRWQLQQCGGPEPPIRKNCWTILSWRVNRFKCRRGKMKGAQRGHLMYFEQFF